MEPETPVSKLSRNLSGCNFSSDEDEDGQAKFKSIDDMLVNSSNESSSVASSHGQSDMHMEEEAEHEHEVDINDNLALARDLGVAQRLQQVEEEGAKSPASSHGQSDTPMEDHMKEAEIKEIDMLTADHSNAYRNKRSTGLPNSDSDDDGLCTASSEDNDTEVHNLCRARFTSTSAKCKADVLYKHARPETSCNKKVAALAKMRLIRQQQASSPKEGFSQLDYCEKFEHCLHTTHMHSMLILSSRLHQLRREYHLRVIWSLTNLHSK